MGAHGSKQRTRRRKEPRIISKYADSDPVEQPQHNFDINIDEPENQPRRTTEEIINALQRNVERKNRNASGTPNAFRKNVQRMNSNASGTPKALRRNVQKKNSNASESSSFHVGISMSKNKRTSISMIFRDAPNYEADITVGTNMPKRSLSYQSNLFADENRNCRTSIGLTKSDGEFRRSIASAVSFDLNSDFPTLETKDNVFSSSSCDLTNHVVETKGLITGPSGYPSNNCGFISLSALENARIKSCVKRILKDFVSDVDPDQLSDWLIEKDVITIPHWNEIQIEKTPSRRCRKLLLYLLESSHPTAFIVLLEAVEKICPHIWERIAHPSNSSQIKATSRDHIIIGQSDASGKKNAASTENHAIIVGQSDASGKRNAASTENHAMIIGKSDASGKRNAASIENHAIIIGKSDASGKRNAASIENHAMIIGKSDASGKRNAASTENHAMISGKSDASGKINATNIENHPFIIRLSDASGNRIATSTDNNAFLIGQSNASGKRNAAGTENNAFIISLSDASGKRIATNIENHAFIIGMSDASGVTNEVLKINLHRPSQLHFAEDVPTTMKRQAAAAVYNNTIYVVGLGIYANEIWKYGFYSRWQMCAYLFQRRRRHSAEFINEVLYICGGFDDTNKRVLDNVEAYNSVSNRCQSVGKLFSPVMNSGNCVAYNNSLYIFGGSYKGKEISSRVQVYNTVQNNCHMLPKPIPVACNMMRAILWRRKVILLGRWNCFIYDFMTETWQDREQYKPGRGYFGLALSNNRIYIIGGATFKTDPEGKVKWKRTYDVRSVAIETLIENSPPSWKVDAKLPKPCLVYALGVLAF